MPGHVPEDPGGLPLPFRAFHPENVKRVAPQEAPAGRKRRAGRGRGWMAELLFENAVLAGPETGSEAGGADLAPAIRATRGQRNPPLRLSQRNPPLRLSRPKEARKTARPATAPL
jgi:hypothetical protein